MCTIAVLKTTQAYYSESWILCIYSFQVGSSVLRKYCRMRAKEETKITAKKHVFLAVFVVTTRNPLLQIKYKMVLWTKLAKFIPWNPGWANVVLLIFLARKSDTIRTITIPDMTKIAIRIWSVFKGGPEVSMSKGAVKINNMIRIMMHNTNVNDDNCNNNNYNYNNSV